jgi:hypothetical protein
MITKAPPKYSAVLQESAGMIPLRMPNSSAART